MPLRISPDSVLFITLDSCRYDTFNDAYSSGHLPNIASIAPLHKAYSPSHFTYGSHAAFWMGFTPGITQSNTPLLNPKAGKLFRMAYSGRDVADNCDSFILSGHNIIDGFKRLGYRTIGTGSVEWFNTATETGSVLSSDFHDFFFSGNTWSLTRQLQWLEDRISSLSPCEPVFVFLNVGETHVPYWHQGAEWDPWPSPCVPFGDSNCCAIKSRTRQRLCLEWVDERLQSLIKLFSKSTTLVCSDHGDCWGEDGLWEHGISHPATITVPLILRVRGVPIH